MNTWVQGSDKSQMASRVIHKFYEPLVLLKALNLEMQDIADFVDPDEVEYRRDAKQAYHALVYKIAHICDNCKGDEGRTITSVMLLNAAAAGGVEYWLTSNRRTTEELETTTSFLTSVLKRIGLAALPQAESVLRKELLDLVLEFNRSRVALYLSTFQVEARKCLAMDHDEEGKAIATGLKRALHSLNFSWDKSAPMAEFIRGCDVLMRSLISLKASDAGECINRRARRIRESGVKQDSNSCWPEMRHMMNRLLAYPQDIEFFLLARSKWPELFRNFEVYFLPSSDPIPRPGRNSSMKAEGIVGRMTRKEKEIQIFKAFVQDLQLINLDQRIQDEYLKPNFAPIVHSEVLLLNALEKSGDISPARFFNGWMYIGSSKPLCRLCQYYFEEHRSGVEHRSSHKNLYISWRVPDVLQSEGVQGEKKRQIMVDRMLLRIRKDAFDLVRKRAPPTFRNHDSLTSSVRMTLDGKWSAASNASDVASDVESMLGSLALDDVEDDEEGGAALG